MITVVIPSFSRPRDLAKALESIRCNSFHGNEIIVLSPDPGPEYLDLGREYHAVVLDDHSRRNGHRIKGLWQVLNTGIEHATHPYVCWLNDDCTVLKDWDRYALNPFDKKDCVLVTLRTRHTEYSSDFVVIRTLYDIPCANYGVIRKGDGLRFDERFSWLHGDADIALQAEFNLGKRVYQTTEPCVIHNHVNDSVRATNESDERTKQDWIYLNKKWRDFSKVGPFRLRGFPARAVNMISLAASRFRRAVEKLCALSPNRRV